MKLRVLATLGAVVSGVSARPARAQAAEPVAAPAHGAGGRSELFAGGEIEGYLRYLQTLGVVAPQPWAIRAFAPRELDRMLPDTAAHPWRARYALAGGRPRGLTLDYVRPTVTARFNSGFPFGSNDGPVWAGRGLTTAVQAGVAARYDTRWAALSLTLAPVAFRAENTGVALAPNGYTSDARYGDLRFARHVDRPRRFGDDAYTVIDPGQSTLRLDVGPVAAGVSTANQTWGPGDRYPTILSNNAAGFLHGFVGTSAPVDLWLLKAHARVVWGRLDQSDYSAVTGSDSFVDLAQPGRRRFASGLVATAQPRGLTGLEVGGARFFHSPWREGGPTARDFRKPFEAFYKRDLEYYTDVPDDPLTDYDNQLAAFFIRWMLPRSGFELFGEFFKEDHNFDARDFVLEPDQNGGYAVGARKAFRRRDGTVLGVRMEVVNLEMTPLGQKRTQGLNYLGSYLRQGHTQRGQLLGADVGVGSAAGASAGVDWYTPRGRWSATWSRTLRQDALYRMPGFGLVVQAITTDPRTLDVMHTLGVEGVLFRGAADVTAGLTAAHDFNREFRRDAFNVNAVLGVRYELGRLRPSPAGAPPTAGTDGER